MTMEVASDPYELKLYQMFQSCLTPQMNGLLNEEALRKLCALLELRDKGAPLISSFTLNGGLKLGISFPLFKEELLNFLGTEFDGCTVTVNAPLTSKFTSPVKDVVNTAAHSLVITDDDTPVSIESPPECSDREVSPKLIVGSKKYGRRSRPHIGDAFSVTDSDNTDEDQLQHNSLNGNEQSIVINNNQVQRSASQSDLNGSRRLRPQHLPGGSKLKRCSSLPARKNLQQTHKLNASKTTKKTSAQQQQQQQQEQQTQQENGSVEIESLDATTATTPTQLENMNAHAIMDIWAQGNVVNGREILIAIGYERGEVNLMQLCKVLEDELHLTDNSQSNFVRALLSLHAVELTNLRQAYRQLHEENIKLRADNKDANRRVSMLAVEIDERHAALEENSKKQIQALEQRQANVVRDLTLRMANDRDNWTNLTTRLEAEIKRLEQDEVKLKTELDLLRTENAELETEQTKAQKHVTELLEQNIQLNNELANSTEKQNDKTYELRCSDCSTADKSTDDEDMLQMIEKISMLQMENSQLRDKNDELAVEVENLQHELTRSKSKEKKKASHTSAAASVDLDDTPPSLLGSDELEQCMAGGAMATKRRGDSPSKARITEESPRLGKLRKCTDESGAASEQSDTSGEWMALNSELQHTAAGNGTVKASAAAAAAAVAALKQKIEELEQQLQSQVKAAPGDERCRELEASLEQMQRAYEECEDYWQSKLSEERQLFEKERQIYEDEQHESDRKFTELMEKVREYEEQFSKDGRLSPIEERDMLEQQYNDLEAEAVEIRENSIIMLEEKSKQIDALQSEIEDLRIRLGESVEILTGACELNSESVAQQLNADAALSPASSPISYLWHQSTIQEPAKNFVSSSMMHDDSSSAVSAMVVLSSPNKKANRPNSNNLTTSETTIFSTTPIDGSSSSTASPSANANFVAPIQKPSRARSPQQAQSEGEIADCETSSTASNKSFDTHSVLSTRSATYATKTSGLSNEKSMSASSLKEELKRLKFFELSLKEQINNLSLQRDGLVMELQQLQEARPVLEKAYARTAHPTLMQRVNQLELKNRHLQNVIKQQQQYAESLMQQSWHHHQAELSELHSRLEAQSGLLAEQTQRLHNTDILVKDMYVENSHLTATVQRLEQQRARVNQINLMQHHQQQLQQPPRLLGPSLSGVLPGMP